MLFFFIIRAAVIIALGIGVILSHYQWTSNVFWWLIGSTGAALLYFAPRYWSMIGGLLLAIYTMSIWPTMIDRLFCRPVGRTLTLANLVYIILVLGSVWVVAYNFVPGGEFTRERTHILLGITMVLIGKYSYARFFNIHVSNALFLRFQCCSFSSLFFLDSLMMEARMNVLVPHGSGRVKKKDISCVDSDSQVVNT